MFYLVQTRSPGNIVMNEAFVEDEEDGYADADVVDGDAYKDMYADADGQDYYNDTAAPSKWEIPWENLTLYNKILGKGNFGKVQLGRVYINDKWVKAAIKTLKRR